MLNQKLKLLAAPIAIIEKLDSARCPLDLGKPLDQMAPQELELLVQTRLYEQQRKGLLEQVRGEADFVSEYAAFVFL